LSGGVPGFERRDLDLETAAPREVGHLRVGLDPDYLAPDRLELAVHKVVTTVIAGVVPRT